ncbi:MAG: transposase [Cyanobacteria bacterium]|nr:transposase [Cyanobacteriota bacterium]
MNTKFDFPLSANGLTLDDDARIDFCCRELARLCPTEDDCAELLYQMVFPNGGICGNCGGKNILRVCPRSFKCTGCKEKTWITARTALKGAHKLLPRLLYILLTDNGIGVSALQFARIAVIDPATAREICGTITAVLEHHMHEDESILMVPSKSLLDACSRRSYDTERGESPKSEESAMQLEEEARVKFEASLGVTGRPIKPILPPADETVEKALAEVLILDEKLVDNAKLVYGELCDKPISFDNLCYKTGLTADNMTGSLSSLQLANLLESPAIGHYVRVDFAVIGRVATAVNDFIGFIKGIFIGIARKYLQKYLAYWWYIKKAGEHCGSLLEKCLAYGPISEGMPKTYKTWLFVKLAA